MSNKRDLISLQDLTNQEFSDLLCLTEDLKRQKNLRLDFLNEKSIGLIFQKPSNRTRVSFEVGIWQLGGNCIYLGPHEIDMGKRESIADVAKTLSRYLNGLVTRTFLHSDIVELAEYASIPIINGLSDLYHPCQACADVFSIKEKFGTLKNLSLAYIGDGNNVCNSLLLACAKVGMNINVSSPKGYEPCQEVISIAEKISSETEAKIQVIESPLTAVKGANVIYADVWTSMGQESESQTRLEIFKDYQINEDLVSQADKNFIFMHCLPAHRGQEVTAQIIDGEHSIVFDQAENRMHVQKAILTFLMGHKKS